MQLCLADNDGGQIWGAVVRVWGSHPGVQSQRPSTHAEDHPLLLSHEGGAHHHRRRYWPTPLPYPHPVPRVWEDASLLLFDLYMTTEGWERGRGWGRGRQVVLECKGIKILWYLSLIWEMIWGKLGGLIHGEGWKLRGKQEKKEKGWYGSGSSVVEIADGRCRMISAGDVMGWDCEKGEVCLRCPLVSCCFWRESIQENQIGQ